MSRHWLWRNVYKDAVNKFDKVWIFDAKFNQSLTAVRYTCKFKAMLFLTQILSTLHSLKLCIRLTKPAKR